MVRALSVLLAVLCAGLAVAQELPRRLSFDDPEFDRALFADAIRILKERDKDPTHKDDPANPWKNGYRYFAELHNGDGFESSCQHQNEIFMTWHRALLLEFEKAVQQTDPPRTLKLMLPYWNFGAPPSGIFVPKDFEDPASPLFEAMRFPGTHPRGRKVPNTELRDTILKTADWRGFQGGECKSIVCDGKPCADCVAKYGALESPAHNLTHVYVGGVDPRTNRPGRMTNDTTAAEDPVFWAFHVYIDLLFDCWQRTHGHLNPCMGPECEGCPDCPLRDLPRWTPRDVFDTRALPPAYAYTYKYDGTACDPPPFQPIVEIAESPGVMALATSERKAGTGPFVYDLKIPSVPFATAYVELEGLEVLPGYTYSGRVYLYPTGTALAPQDARFRERYQVGEFAVWGLSKEHAHGEGSAAEIPEVGASVNATTELSYLAKKEPGSVWKLAIVFDPLTDALGAEANAGERITLDRVTIVFDRQWREELHAER